MATGSDSTLSIEKTGDVSLNLSLSNSALNAAKSKNSGIPLMPGLRPNAFTIVSFGFQFLTGSFSWKKKHLFKSQAGDKESHEAQKEHLEHLRQTRDRHLATYHEAKNAVKEFDSQALLWIDYSNRRQLTDEEQALVDEVT